MSAPTIIVTRAEPGASSTATRLEKLGVRPIISPALTLSLVQPLPIIDTSEAAGILFTSANGVRFFAEVCRARKLVAWCVGPSTYAAATEAGFTIAYNADGNSEDLARLVKANTSPSDGKLLHIANTQAGDTLQKSLKRDGFNVEFIGLYEPTEMAQLSSQAATYLQKQKPVCVLVHSAKGAASFAKLVAPFTDIQITFICVSDKAARPIARLGEVRVAERPNEEALLRVVSNWKLAL